MDSLQMGSTQSLLIVVAVAFSPVIVLFLADIIGRALRQQREMGSEPPSNGGTGITQ
jgi:hypothetical protein